MSLSPIHSSRLNFAQLQKIQFAIGRSDEILFDSESMPAAAESLKKISSIQILYIKNFSDDKGRSVPLPVTFEGENSSAFGTAELQDTPCEVSLGSQNNIKGRVHQVDGDFLSRFNVFAGTVLEAKPLESDPACLRLKISLGEQGAAEVTLPDTDPLTVLKGKKVIVWNNLQQECRFDDPAHLFFTSDRGKNIPFLLTSDIPDGTKWSIPNEAYKAKL